MDVSIIIPARYDSTRFPGKPLAKINGKEMILHTVDGCSKAFGKECVFVTTDDNRISDVVTSAGYKVIMTSKEQPLLTGSDRVAYAASFLDSYYIINVQGDEPLINPEDIRNVYSAMKHNPGYVINCYGYCEDKSKGDKNTIKVVLNNYEREEETLCYMSRAPIPHKSKYYRKQVCIYGYNKYSFLNMFGEDKGRSTLEISEDIEILRVLDHGLKVQMLSVEGKYQSVDVPEDIKKVEEILNDKK